MITKVSTNLYRGPKISSHDIFLEMQRLEIKEIINLETETKELVFGGANDEICMCLTRNIRLYDFQLNGYLPPHPEDVKAILRILEKRTAPTYIHCRHGHERTGFVIAVYRMVIEGVSYELAYKEWKDMGCHPLWLFFWKKELRAYEQIKI